MINKTHYNTIFVLLAFSFIFPYEIYAQNTRRTPAVRRTPVTRRPATNTNQSTQNRATQNRATSSRQASSRTVTRGTQRRTPSPRNPSNRGGGGNSWSVSRDAAALFIQPFNVYAKTGELIDLEINLSNPENERFDNLSMYIEYDPETLEWVGIDASNLTANQIGKAEPVSKQIRPGLFQYSIEVNEKADWQSNDLLKFQLRALKESSGTSVNFYNEDEYKTAVKLQSKNILGMDAGDFDKGLVGSYIIVKPPDSEKEDGYKILTSTTNQTSLETDDGEEVVNPIILGLNTEQEKVFVGDEFKVHILYSNPYNLPVEKIKLAIRFDPKALKVIDSPHKENYIQTGINIEDGPNHKDFPFQLHLANKADNDRGTINYEKATYHPQRLSSKGHLATIYFEALRECERVPIWFDIDEEGNLKSEVMAYGENQLQGSVESNLVQSVAMEILPSSSEVTQ